MCLIVDVNAVHLLIQGDHGHEPVNAALAKKHTFVSYGGHLAEEYAKSRQIVAWINELRRSGTAVLVPSAAVNKEQDTVERSGLCQSNDPHIIALARVGKARLLCSSDTGLHADFTNPQLLSSPQGRVYQKPSHAHLLRGSCGGCWKPS
jgi:hypothetical protein